MASQVAAMAAPLAMQAGKGIWDVAKGPLKDLGKQALGWGGNKLMEWSGKGKDKSKDLIQSGGDYGQKMANQGIGSGQDWLSQQAQNYLPSFMQPMAQQGISSGGDWLRQQAGGGIQQGQDYLQGMANQGINQAQGYGQNMLNQGQNYLNNFIPGQGGQPALGSPQGQIPQAPQLPPGMMAPQQQQMIPGAPQFPQGMMMPYQQQYNPWNPNTFRR